MKYGVNSIFTKKKCRNTENVRSVTMKKLLAMLLALVMVLSLAACGTTEPETPEVPEEPEVETPEEPEVELTYVEEKAAEYSINQTNAHITDIRISRCNRCFR